MSGQERHDEGKMKLLLLVVCSTVFGCSAAKPACAVIDLANRACDVFVVSYPCADGGTCTERVPREELLDMARSRAAGGTGDAGPFDTQ